MRLEFRSALSIYGRLNKELDNRINQTIAVIIQTYCATIISSMGILCKQLNLYIFGNLVT